MGYSFVRVAPLAAAIFHFRFLFHIVNITSVSSVTTITTTTHPAMAPPTAAATDTPVAALDSMLLLLESELVVEISQTEVLSQAEMTVANCINTDRKNNIIVEIRDLVTPTWWC